MAEEKKKRRGRKAYLNDFTRNMAGEYVYTGRYVDWRSPRPAALLRLWGCGGGAVLAAVTAGCLPDTGLTGAVWALLPYVLCLVGSVTCLYAVGRLSAAGDLLREYVYEETALQLPVRCRATQVLALLAMAGSGINLLLPGFSGALLPALAVPVLEGAVLVFVTLLRKTVMALKWSIE